MFEDRNIYLHRYLEILHKGRSALPGVTVQEMWWFLETTVQLGHDQRDKMKDYWSTLDQYITAFYCNIPKQDRLHGVLRFVHFSANKKEQNKTDENATVESESFVWQAEWFTC